MVNEAICIEAPKIIKRYTVADGTAIAKGTILQVSGGSINCAKATDATFRNTFAGIAVEEKTASDGITEIGAAIDGVWDIFQCATATTAGLMVSCSGSNLCGAAIAADTISGAIMGKLLEPGTASVANRVRLGGI